MCRGRAEKKEVPSEIWEQDGRRLIGYWVGMEFWGRGLATRALAEFVLTTMEGGVMQARTHRSLETFDACVKQLRNYFDHLFAAARGRTGA